MLVRASAAAVALTLSVQVQAQSIPEEEITYNSHVAAIINENCVVCHRAGGIAPMTFTSYEAVRPWAPIIGYRVGRREMPPYAYDQGIGVQHLIGDWRLEQQDIDTVLAWVEQGAPLGNTDIIPPAVEIPSLEEWNFAGELGQPDLVLESQSIDIPAAGNDMWHRPYTLTGLNDDRCIRAMQVKPKGAAKAVVHHANSTVETPNGDGTYERFSQLTEYAMGKWGEMMPEGVCRKLPANGRIAWDIHMYPGGLGSAAPGAMIEDNVVELGVWFYDKGYENEAQYRPGPALIHSGIARQSDHSAARPRDDTGFSFVRPSRANRQLPASRTPAHECRVAGDLLSRNGEDRICQPDLELERDLASQSYLRAQRRAAFTDRSRTRDQAVVRQYRRKSK